MIIGKCKYRKYRGTVCLYGNVERTISASDCANCRVSARERMKDRRTGPRRKRSARTEKASDRRTRDRRKKA